MLSWHDSSTRDLMDSLSDLVEKYNKYLRETNGTDQLNIHKQLQQIMDTIRNFLPADNS